MTEVLEYGTDETALHYKNGTPGQGGTADTKPKLTLKGIRKRGMKGLPPKQFDSRIGGVTPFDGVGSYSGGATGGLMTFANSYEREGKMIPESTHTVRLEYGHQDGQSETYKVKAKDKASAIKAAITKHRKNRPYDSVEMLSNNAYHLGTEK
jgi:hypothetical protein